MDKNEFIANYEDGTEEIITIETSVADIGNRANPSSNMNVNRTLRIKRNGEIINRIKKGEYKTLDGDKLTSNSPNAP